MKIPIAAANVLRQNKYIFFLTVTQLHKDFFTQKVSHYFKLTITVTFHFLS